MAELLELFIQLGDWLIGKKGCLAFFGWCVVVLAVGLGLLELLASIESCLAHR